MPYGTPIAPGEWEAAYPSQSPNRYASKRRTDDRRQWALAQMLAGSSTAPVQHWAQGLARVGQAMIGGYFSGQADREDANRDKAKGEAWAKALEAFGRGDTAEAQRVLAGAPESADLNMRLTMADAERRQRAAERGEDRQWRVEDRQWQKDNRQGPQPPSLVSMQDPQSGEVVWFDPKTGQPVSRSKVGEGNGLRPWGQPPQQPQAAPSPQAMPPGVPAPPPAMAPQGGPPMPPQAAPPMPQAGGMPPQVDPALVQEALRSRRMTRQLDVPGSDDGAPPASMPGMSQQPTPQAAPMGGPMGMNLDAPRPPPMQAQQTQAPAPQQHQGVPPGFVPMGRNGKLEIQGGMALYGHPDGRQMLGPIPGAPPAERWEDVKGPDGRVMAQRNTVTGQMQKSPIAENHQLTEAQAKAYAFAKMAAPAIPLLEGLVFNKDGTPNPQYPGTLSRGLVEGVNIPFTGINISGNSIAPEAAQKWKAAEQQIIDAFLRFESGATITDPEFIRKMREIIPQPNDHDSVKRQKLSQLRTQWESLASISGRSQEFGLKPADAGAYALPPAPPMPAPAAPPAPKQGGPSVEGGTLVWDAQNKRWAQ